MDEIEKSVIQRMNRQIADGIIMNEEILSSLLERNIFQTSMIEVIKSEKTPMKQAYKMLELLPKRGPRAFHGFVEVIQEDYPWIATKLQTELEDKQTAQLTLHKNGTYTEVRKAEHDFDDIRKKVNTFVHKHFGQSKKLAEKEKKLISTWLTKELTNERVRLETLEASQSTASETEDVDGDQVTFTLARIQEELYDIHGKIKDFLRLEELEKTNNVFLLGENESVFPGMNYDTEDMSFQLVHREVSELCDLFVTMKRDLDASLDHFDPSNRINGLPLLVESLVVTKNKQLESINQMEKRNADLIEKLGEMTEEIHTLEMKHVYKQRQLDAQIRELSNLRHDKYNAHDRIKQLEKDNQECMITIEALKTQINQLQNPKTTRVKRRELSKSPMRKSNASLTRAANYNSTAFGRQSYSSTPMFSEQKKRANTNDLRFSVKHKQ